MFVYLYFGWIIVGVLVDGFVLDNYVFFVCGDFVGFEWVLYFVNGWVIEYVFDLQCLCWCLVDGSVSGELDYCVSLLWENFYLVDFFKQENGWLVLVSLVLDFDNQVFIVVFGYLFDCVVCEQGLFVWVLVGWELIGVEVEFLYGSFDCLWQFGVCLYVFSDELVGLCNCYVYSVSEVYEYIYFNFVFYIW